MPDRETAAGNNARLLRGLIWASVLLAPLAAVVVLLGDNSGSVRFAVLLLAASVASIGASMLIRNDPVLHRMDVEDRVGEEIEVLRRELRAEFSRPAAPAPGPGPARAAVPGAMPARAAVPGAMPARAAAAVVPPPAPMPVPAAEGGFFAGEDPYPGDQYADSWGSDQQYAEPEYADHPYADSPYADQPFADQPPAEPAFVEPAFAEPAFVEPAFTGSARPGVAAVAVAAVRPAPPLGRSPGHVSGAVPTGYGPGGSTGRHGPGVFPGGGGPGGSLDGRGPGVPPAAPEPAMAPPRREPGMSTGGRNPGAPPARREPGMSTGSRSAAGGPVPRQRGPVAPQQPGTGPIPQSGTGPIPQSGAPRATAGAQYGRAESLDGDFGASNGYAAAPVYGSPAAGATYGSAAGGTYGVTPDDDLDAAPGAGTYGGGTYGAAPDGNAVPGAGTYGGGTYGAAPEDDDLDAVRGAYGAAGGGVYGGAQYASAEGYVAADGDYGPHSEDYGYHGEYENSGDVRYGQVEDYASAEAGYDEYGPANGPGPGEDYDDPTGAASSDPNYRARRHRPSANDTNIGSLADFAAYGGYVPQPDERYVNDFGPPPATRR
jgi:hypothetical protein